LGSVLLFGTQNSISTYICIWWSE